MFDVLDFQECKTKRGEKPSMVQNLLDPARERVCGDHYRLSDKSSRRLSRQQVVSYAYSFFLDLLQAAALIPSFVSPGTDNPCVESLSHSPDGVRGLIDLRLLSWELSVV